MLSAHSLGKRYGRRWLFRGVEFALGQGDVLCVLGQNGSGKSTLLKVLSGLVSPSEGRVDRPRRAALGYAALDQALYPALTAAEHLELTGKLRGVAPRTDELLDQVGLAGERARPVGQYSTGMRGRLKLAIAVQARPDALLLDEPTAGLDTAGRAVLAEVIAAQRARGGTVIATNAAEDRAFATHELPLDD